MGKRMLIDAAHPEETRVVVLSGTRLEEFDFESSTKKQVKGNIYLAKVTRVEPSLQAAFVDYGGNRHGFLAFNEIHPDYYQIPIADRQALIDEEERAARAAEAEADRRAGRRARERERRAGRQRTEIKSEPINETDEATTDAGEPFAMAAASELMTPAADGVLAEGSPPPVEDAIEEPPSHVNWADDAAISEEPFAHAETAAEGEP